MTQEARDALEKATKELFHENQAKLPEEDRCAKNNQKMCGDRHDGWTCTKPRDHKGQHIAHSNLGYAIERWSNAS